MNNSNVRVAFMLCLSLILLSPSMAKAKKSDHSGHHHNSSSESVSSEPTHSSHSAVLPSASALITLSDGSWSNPKIWNKGRVPKAGDAVKIAAGTAVVYDVRSEADIAEVVVDGSLIFSRAVNTNLDAGRLIVNPSGYLEIGTETSPIPPSVTSRIRITEDSVSTPDLHSDMTAMSSGGLMVMGKAELHGAPIKPSFTKLAETAPAGGKTIKLIEKADGWRAGDEIVLGGGFDKSEIAKIASVDGNLINLESPLLHDHTAAIHKLPDGKTAEFRSDVGNLSRNVKITSKYPDTARGHTMVMNPGKWRVSYVEYRNLGGLAKPFPSKPLPQPLLGRYPIHFHRLGTASPVAGERLTLSDTMYIKGVSIVGTQNHALRIHGTDRVIVEDTIAYDTLGHSFDIGEDGSEMENVIRRNLAVKARSAWNLNSTSDRPQASFFEQNPEASGFWFGNMGQIVVGNVVSDAKKGFGMYKIRPTPPNRLLGGVEVEPNDIPIKRFADNEVYGSGVGVTLYHFVGVNAGKIDNMKIWMCAKVNQVTTGDGSRLIWRNPVIAQIKENCGLCLEKGQKRIGQSVEGGSVVERIIASKKKKKDQSL